MTETGNLYPTIASRSVKLFFLEEIRRFNFAGISLQQFRDQLKELLNVSLDALAIKYQDDEGDWISVASDSELNLAFQLSGAKPLRVKLESIPAMMVPNSTNVPLLVVAHPPSGDVSPKGNIKDLKKKELKEQVKQAKRELKMGQKEIKNTFKKELKAAKHEYRKEIGDAKKGLKYAARFVKHVTVDDDHIFTANTAFVKTWRFRNDGNVAWPEKCTLLFIGKNGDQLGAPSFVLIEKSVAPGEEIDVSVGMVAPSEPGSYFGYWKLAGPDGKKFGQRVRVLIKVAGETSSSSESEENTSGWSDLIVQLESMGFQDKTLNVKLLVKYNGNIDKVIQRLLKRQQKMSGVKGKH